MKDSGARWPLPMVHGRTCERSESSRDPTGEGVRPVLRLALRPFPSRRDDGQRDPRKRCGLDQHADRLVVLCPGSVGLTQMLFQFAFMLPTSYIVPARCPLFPRICASDQFRRANRHFPLDHTGLRSSITVHLARHPGLSRCDRPARVPRDGSPAGRSGSAALLVLIALTTPPKLRRWRLTGQHRLVPAIPKASKDYVQVG